jgi:hypothetical protein
MLDIVFGRNVRLSLLRRDLDLATYPSSSFHIHASARFLGGDWFRRSIICILTIRLLSRLLFVVLL